MLVAWFELIAGLVLLIVAGEFLVSSSVKLALYLKVSSLVVGLTVVSFGTSFPELVVSVNAALGGHPDISIGNVVGSNIANLGLVLGLSALFFPMAVSRSTIMIDWPLMVACSLLFILFIWNGVLSTQEGAFFVVALLIYNVWMIRDSRKRTKHASSQDLPQENVSPQLIRNLIIFFISLVGLVFGSKLLVNGAVDIARIMEVEERVIAVTIIAFGTSVPELATSLIALYRNEVSISVGNLIGSNIFNILGILGVTSFIQPIAINAATLESDVYWFLAIPILLYPFLITRFKVGRVEGGLLLGIYIAYIAINF